MHKNIQRKWDLASDETKQRCLTAIIARYEEVQDGEIGLITAQEVLDIITEAIGPSIYNQGLEDARKLLTTKLVDLDIELDILKQPL